MMLEIMCVFGEFGAPMLRKGPQATRGVGVGRTKKTTKVKLTIRPEEGSRLSAELDVPLEGLVEQIKEL